MEITYQQVLKNSIVYDMYLDTADQNYVVARWCFQQNLAVDFLWNATHCLEKTMKAVLLLNGQSGTRQANDQPFYGHNLKLMFPKISELVGNLLPNLLIRPNEIDNDLHWHTESVEQFVGRISMDGDAHNRYQVYGHTLHSADLYKFDRVFYAIRRLCCPLDSYLFGNIRHNQPTFTFRQQLGRNANYMPHWRNSRLARLIGAKASADLRHAVLNHNLMFAPDYDHRGLSWGSSSLNPVLWRRLLLPAEQCANDEDRGDLIELFNWVLKNIGLPPGVQAQLRNERDRLADPT